MKHKKLFLVWFLAAGIFFPIFGQEKTIPLNALKLDEALEYAYSHSPAFTIQQLKEKQAAYKLAQIKSNNLPNIYAGSDLRRNLIIPATPIPASMINPSAPKDELMYMRFNTPWSVAAGINLTYDIFNPETIGRKSQQEKQLRIAEMDTRIAKNQLKEQLSQAYIDCLIAQVQRDAATADTAYLNQLWENSKTLFQNNQASRVDKNNAELNYNNSLSRYHQAQTILHHAKVNLLLLMGCDMNDENLARLQLAENIETLYERLSQNLRAAEGEPILTQSRQNFIISLSEANVSNAKLKFLPSLALTGYYGANYYGNQLKLGESDRWFGNSFLALSLRIPITQSISVAKEVAQLRVQEMIEKENLQSIKNNADAELNKARNDLKIYVADYQVKRDNLRLLNENIAAVQVQAQKSYVKESDIAAEKLRAQSAQAEYLQAAYQMLSSYIAIESLLEK